MVDLAASGSDVLNVVAALAGGVFIAGALVLAVYFGMRVMDRELPHPSPEEQPTLPAGGAIREIREMREAEEMPLSAGGERLLPHELRRQSTRRGTDQKRKRWLPGSSGSFGSGGLGHV
ncbi:DUF6479 family protein [Streptomyces sp. YS415]|uniref:DUF6479 family protein n=1 Tax=Streptomyces sp. YS415 TaxID=2944806 RepID=UPI0020208616|nr:DUF6479 family protein [Streptomyces sp. YS415]MCL7428884.1 DUF6479 family protein [Streptomyces sp. YS415]